ncbi:hypothetical protein M9H77_01792 [Catharanthus roseus]|uniref:Uncharacterized protein n=1 Tax=Catharanthus roseus TaxID=4058 RepID=A0ACC0C6P4_CATRO|nr:hypothetical protein M9H77_01792 [Catharanthus roseus]
MARYLWTIPADISKEGIHILVEFEPIDQQNIPITHDMNTTSLPEYIMAITQMVSDEPSMLYSAVNNDDDEVDRSDGDDAVSSQSESDDDNKLEEGEFQTPINPVNPVNPVTENTVQQWESSQWFSNARYDYTQTGAFLDIGSGSPVDDTIESGTVRLLDRNDSMTDIQLGMRFIDKVHAIEQNKHRNLSSKFISMSISHIVANDLEIPISNIIQEVQVLYQTGCTYKRAWYARKFAIESVFGS